MSYISGLAKSVDAQPLTLQCTQQNFISGLNLRSGTAPSSTAQTSYVMSGAQVSTISSTPVVQVPYERTVSECPPASHNRISAVPQPYSDAALSLCTAVTPISAVSAIVPFVPRGLKRKAASDAAVDEHGVAQDMLHSIEM